MVDELYVRKRIGLTRQFLAPSLVAQGRDDFAWLVRLDERCPLLDEQLELLASMPFPTIPLVVGGDKKHSSDTISTTKADWRSAIAEHLRDETTHVLTTRVDDDDALAPDFVDRLRRKVEPSPTPVAYSFPRGYCVKLLRGRSRFGTWRLVENQFCSLLSTREPLTLVLDRRHGEVGQLGPWQIVDEKPGHLWVRHPRSKSAGGRFKVGSPIAELVARWPFLEGLK